MDSNHRRRKPAELQSAPFGHSGNCPSVYSASSLIYYHSSEWEGRSAFSCKHTNPQEGIQESRTKVHTKSEITKLLAKKLLCRFRFRETHRYLRRLMKRLMAMIFPTEIRRMMIKPSPRDESILPGVARPSNLGRYRHRTQKSSPVART